MPKLSDIRSSELSFVRRGAVRRPFLFTKTDSDELDVAPELLDALEKQADGEDAFLKGLFGDQDIDEDTVAAAAASYRLAKASGVDLAKVAKAMKKPDGPDGDDQDGDDDEELDEISKAEEPVYKRDFTAGQRRELAKKGHALPNGSYPIDSKDDIGPALTLARSGHGDTAAAKALIKRRARELGATDQLPDDWALTKEDTTMPETTTVPIKKDDGTWDLSGVPETARESVEAVLKAHDDEVAELRKQADAEKTKADEALQIAKAEQENRLTREFIAKSAELQHVAKDDTEFGGVLRDISKAEQDGSVPEGTLGKLETVLKAADEQIKKGGLFSELGRAGGAAGDSDAQAKLDAAAAEIRKSDTTLTREQAVAKALERNPNLYTELKENA